MREGVKEFVVGCVWLQQERRPITNFSPHEYIKYILIFQNQTFRFNLFMPFNSDTTPCDAATEEFTIQVDNLLVKRLVFSFLFVFQSASFHSLFWRGSRREAAPSALPAGGLSCHRRKSQTQSQHGRCLMGGGSVTGVRVHVRDKTRALLEKALRSLLRFANLSAAACSLRPRISLSLCCCFVFFAHVYFSEQCFP